MAWLLDDEDISDLSYQEYLAETWEEVLTILDRWPWRKMVPDEDGVHPQFMSIIKDALSLRGEDGLSEGWMELLQGG